MSKQSDVTTQFDRFTMECKKQALPSERTRKGGQFRREGHIVATVRKVFTTPLLAEAIQACPLFLGCDSPKNCEFHKVGAYIPEGLGDSRIQRVPVTRCERSGIFLSLEVQVLSQAISDVLICCASE